MNFITKLFGDPNQKEINKLQTTVEEINKLESAFEYFSNDELKKKTEEFKKQLADGKSLDDILSEAFACAREAAKRTLGQRHFDVQLIGGVILHQGKIAEMKTGEGKTLTSTLAIYLNALTGKGVHIVTVNDYLARRDANWMGPIYHLLGLSVGCINHEASYIYESDMAPDRNETTVEMVNLKPVSRREAYAADITYGTNNEYGFDYLRDNMAGRLEDMAQRDLHYAIVDEIDSILIDEARTPLIISMPDMESTKMYEQFARLVPRLKENEDYDIDEKRRAVTLTEEGMEKIEKLLGLGNIYDYNSIRYVHHLEQALKAQILFKRDRDYVVKPARNASYGDAGGNGEIIIVDEFTGRLMPGRRYSEGLHQAIEAKEGVAVQRESRTLASITFQNYFRMYKKLAGMTGTALTSAEEFHKVYNLDVISVPTNEPLIRKDLPDSIYRTENGKYQALIREIKSRYEKGQPVLVGTVSIEKNEKLSAFLNREGISHEILNAKQHEREAQIIARAGEFGAVTIATNMAGRGVDIMLGGKPPAEIKNQKSKIKIEEGDLFKEYQENKDKIIALGGLHIIGTERHEARRIDNQLRGRAGRQGDPGSSQFFLSMEDDLLRVFGPDKIKNMMEFLQIPEDQPIESKMVSSAIESAQEKIEGFNFDIRKHILEYDDVMNKQRETIYAKRRNILQTANHKSQIINYIEEEIKKIVEFNTEIKEIYEAVNAMFVLPISTCDKLNEFKEKEQMEKYLIDLAYGDYEQKEKEIGADIMRQAEKEIMLHVIDTFWMDHLENMEHLRDSVRLRAYGQKDPLVEYKNEGSRLFKDLLTAIQSAVASTIFKLNSGMMSSSAKAMEDKPFLSPRNGAPASVKTTAGKKVGLPAEARRAKVGRNDPCPCGSGKKYKRCHGK